MRHATTRARKPEPTYATSPSKLGRHARRVHTALRTAPPSIQNDAVSSYRHVFNPLPLLRLAHAAAGPMALSHGREVGSHRPLPVIGQLLLPIFPIPPDKDHLWWYSWPSYRADGLDSVRKGLLPLVKGCAYPARLLPDPTFRHHGRRKQVPQRRETQKLPLDGAIVAPVLQPRPRLITLQGFLDLFSHRAGVFQETDGGVDATAHLR
ncbi:uncharacterized protein LY79DRAFT_186496 [Colletotrichum navitas]|uniref:Uncharacterized protein n=1 Tax=Colletotrichum navitas TaxID=681940 RepID=A0AAD8PIB9_9PEZI|nr:uncharacterized protein LY79DRAFT_186496 [Colletotrichum navitas]KAK1561614.1 hypothetical protein LY79DRAFT_186496 [Colletotrichum navitas]